MPGSERWSVDLFFACGGLRGVFCKIAFVFAKPYAAGVFIPGHVKKVVRQRIKPQPSTKTGDGVIPCQIGKRPATVSQTGRLFCGWSRKNGYVRPLTLRLSRNSAWPHREKWDTVCWTISVKSILCKPRKARRKLRRAAFHLPWSTERGTLLQSGWRLLLTGAGRSPSTAAVSR